jgi:hypothetical protein
MKFFTSFFSDRIPRPKTCRKLREWSSQVADWRKNRDWSIVEQHFFKKLRNCDCRSAFFKLRNCECGLKKKLRLPTSADLYEALSCEAFMYTAHCHKLMANSLNSTALCFGVKKSIFKFDIVTRNQNYVFFYQWISIKYCFVRTAERKICTEL